MQEAKVVGPSGVDWFGNSPVPRLLGRPTSSSCSADDSDAAAEPTTSVAACASDANQLKPRAQTMVGSRRVDRRQRARDHRRAV